MLMCAEDGVMLAMDMEVMNGIGLTTNTDNYSNGMVSDNELLMWRRPIKADDVLGLTKPTQGYLCKPEDDIYHIHFTHFHIRDLDSGTVLLDIKKHSSSDSENKVHETSGCFIRYRFAPSFLKLKEVGATLEFMVGQKALKNFRMIERHYFQDTLLKSFDFEFGFCIPSSRNTCEHIYELPELHDELVHEMITHPYETRSDTFYFVDNRLVMHHKAEYAYDADQ
ncbi:protein unc-119 homolog B-like [Protopterus annectens]|uniref:protein unc-119 homolog B-like n=1 Tax=Protopterus annectens TaxID=7888 RepID=UPI001CF9AFF2|nr:protein unc-119 homolog B-like [Protopterus annectens]